MNYENKKSFSLPIYKDTLNYCPIVCFRIGSEMKSAYVLFCGFEDEYPLEIKKKRGNIYEIKGLEEFSYFSGIKDYTIFLDSKKSTIEFEYYKSGLKNNISYLILSRNGKKNPHIHPLLFK